MKSYESLLHVICSAMLTSIFYNNHVYVKVFISLKNVKTLNIMEYNYNILWLKHKIKTYIHYNDTSIMRIYLALIEQHHL